MTHPNDPDSQHRAPVPDSQQGTGSGFTAATWASLAFIVLLFGGVAFWAYQSGDMERAAINKPGAERTAPTTTGQGNAPPKAPMAKDTAR